MSLTDACPFSYWTTAVPALKFTLTVRTPATRSRVRRTRGGQE